MARVEILEHTSLGVRARVRVTEAAMWLIVFRPNMHRWVLCACIPDGDTDGRTFHFDIPSAKQMHNDALGLTPETVAALDDALRSDRDARKAAA